MDIDIKKPKRRIAVVDADLPMVHEILRKVSDKYDFEYTNEEDADYVFYSVAGMDVLKYKGVRIFITGENVAPNFGVADYAMAFDRLHFGDRYIWLPLIKLYGDAYATFLKPRRPVEDVCREKTEFYASVMSSTKNSAPERMRIFDLLSQYKTVNSGGRWKNNTGGPVADKLAFQKKHRFVIAFENTSWASYLTEKLAEAAQADAVPIYWGDPRVGELFNPKAFINCHKFNSFEEVVEEVKRVDSDEALYRQYLSEPWFRDGIEPEELRDETFARFLSVIFDQEWSQAFRRNRGQWGIKQEKRLYRMSHRPLSHALYLLKDKWRKFRRGVFKKRKGK